MLISRKRLKLETFTAEVDMLPMLTEVDRGDLVGHSPAPIAAEEEGSPIALEETHLSITSRACAPIPFAKCGSIRGRFPSSISATMIPTSPERPKVPLLS